MTTDGWEWIKQQPPYWEAPDRLRAPTASGEYNVGVQMISSNIIGNDVVELAAEYMAESARMELWMGAHEPPLTMRQRFEIARTTSEALRLVYESWIAFEAAYEASGGIVDEVQEERQSLKAVLNEAINSVAQVRSD